MDKVKAKEFLRSLLKSRGAPKELLARQKAHRATLKVIAEALGKEPMTVPQLVEATGLDSKDLFWHVNAMRKYGQVEIREEVEGYLSYTLIEKQQEQVHE